MNKSNRRTFIRGALAAGAGLAASPFLSQAGPIRFNPDDLYMVGPMKGYTPHIGSMLSMMIMMRQWIVWGVQDLTVEQLDYQIDDQSNSIGAMLLHLAATEKYYQLNTFDSMEWGSWSNKIKDEWDLPMNLGPEARDEIKGNDINYYLGKLEEVRKDTEKSFAKKDDDWLMESEKFFQDKPTTNFAKWFHVCEHESNHNGQIKFIRKRLPV